MNRVKLSELIVQKLTDNAETLSRDYHSHERIQYFVLDNLLPKDIALSIFKAFPRVETMMLKSSLAEMKYVSALVSNYDPLIKETIYAFQEPDVVKAIQSITNIDGLTADPQLYAGGISAMKKGHFLNPHLDNSHNHQRDKYRTLNLLYYVTPDWDPAFGGNLELWPEGPKGKSLTIENVCNRLVVMRTNRQSWHSVTKVIDDRLRCCLSNYYFSEQSPEHETYYHVTSFRGRPEEKMKDLILKVDQSLRNIVRGFFPKVIVPTRHIYKESNKQ